MSSAFEIAGIGLSTQQKALETVASNIANVNTPGFKRSDVAFAELISQSHLSGTPSARLDGVSPVAGLSATLVPRIDLQGSLDTTGAMLDLAVDGRGFVELMGPSGKSVLWRGGSLMVNDDGLLSADNGMPLRALISVPREASQITIDAGGRVSASAGTGGEVWELGQIMVVQPSASEDLTRRDGGLYEAGVFSQLTEMQPGEDGAGVLVQGAIERSNVDLNEEMVRMMIVQRAYSANAKVIQAADELTTIVNSLRR
jgi:flagellar basal-body rod protein FlgG